MRSESGSKRRLLQSLCIIDREVRCRSWSLSRWCFCGVIHAFHTLQHIAQTHRSSPINGIRRLRGSLLPRYSDWGSHLGKWAQVRDSFPGRRAAPKRNGMGRQSPYSLSFAGQEVIGRIQQPWTPSSSLSETVLSSTISVPRGRRSHETCSWVLSELARDEKEEEKGERRGPGPACTYTGVL